MWRSSAYDPTADAPPPLNATKLGLFWGNNLHETLATLQPLVSSMEYVKAWSNRTRHAFKEDVKLGHTLQLDVETLRSAFYFDPTLQLLDTSRRRSRRVVSARQG